MPNDSKTDSHAARIEAQFSAQAAAFAQSPALHAAEALALIVEAAAPSTSESMLDVACGPGSVVAAFAPRVRAATGLDATDAMLGQSRRLSSERKLDNVEWMRGDVYALPFDDGAFDIVTCRFAFHHFERPEAAFGEMLRVCGRGGRIVVCDGLASADPAKAKALNDFERLRDPSTVEFRTFDYFRALFARCGAGEPETRFYKHPGTLSGLLKSSYPADGDRDRLRALIEQSVEGDLFGLNAHHRDDDILLETPVAILSAQKGA